jgi:hypothetical protein
MSQPAIRQLAGAPRKNFRNTGASTGQLKSEPILAPAGSGRCEGTISRREPTCTTRRCASAGSGGGGVRIRAGAERACRARRIKAGGKARGQPRSRERHLFPHCDLKVPSPHQLSLHIGLLSLGQRGRRRLHQLVGTEWTGCS